MALDENINTLEKAKFTEDSDGNTAVRTTTSDKFNEISSANSYTTPLTSDATFTGTYETTLDAAVIVMALKADVAGTLYLDFSPDGVNTDSTLTFDVAANINEVHRVKITRSFYRVRYTNNGADQTFFRLQTMKSKDSGLLTSPLNLSISQDADATVCRSISDELTIAEGLLSGFSVVNKRGKNDDVDTGTVPEDIWDAGGAYTGFPTGAPENLMAVSTDPEDTGIVTFIYLASTTTTAWQAATVTLTGTTPVNTGISAYRCHTASYSNSSATGFNIGTISLYHQVTTANVFLTIPPGQSQSNAAVYTVPFGNTALIWNVNGAIRRPNAGFYADVSFWIRDFGRSPRLRVPSVMTDGVKLDRHYFTGISLNPLADVTLRITTVSSNNISVVGGFDILLIRDT